MFDSFNRSSMVKSSLNSLVYAKLPDVTSLFDLFDFNISSLTSMKISIPGSSFSMKGSTYSIRATYLLLYPR